MDAFGDGLRAYKVEPVGGPSDGWRVRFYIDGEEVGGAVCRTADDADDAGLDFMLKLAPGGFHG